MTTSPDSSQPPRARVGFIGLGHMGTPMARQLIKAGYDVTVWSRSAAHVDELVADGATRAASPADAIATGHLFSMLANEDIVREVCTPARLEAAPDATVLEHCAWWAEHSDQQLSEATMWRAMRRLGWTQKKRHWQPASATRRHAQPGVRPRPSSIRSSWSLLTKAAPPSP